jgi:hypothetical protein
MLVPLYGFLKGDTVGLVVLVHEEQTVAEIARQLQQASSVRVAPSTRAQVYFRGMKLDSKSTIAASGLSALDRVDVIPERP